MKEAHRLTKGTVTRMRHAQNGRCHLKSCNREFAEGDEVIRVGKHVYHSTCESALYIDLDDSEEVETA